MPLLTLLAPGLLMGGGEPPVVAPPVSNPVSFVAVLGSQTVAADVLGSRTVSADVLGST